MKNGNDGQNAPEKVGYTRYYEHDGMLRAYANRSMVLAMVFGVIALSSFAFAVYVRLQPPTVIRVDSEGEAAIVGGTPSPGHTRGLTFTASAAEAAPTDVEAKAVVRRFLDHYLNYTPATVDRQMADALNMMTGNFKALVLSRLREDDTINKIQDDQIITNFTVRTISAVQGSPLPDRNKILPPCMKRKPLGGKGLKAMLSRMAPKSRAARLVRTTLELKRVSDRVKLPEIPEPVRELFCDCNPPVPVLLAIYQLGDAIEACFDDERQSMLELTPEPWPLIPFNGTDRESTRKAFDILGGVLDTLVAARRVLNLVPGWEAIRGNEEKRS
jgi:hypothetical protein